MARDEWGHLALITALSVVDDTTLLRKLVVSELQVGGASNLTAVQTPRKAPGPMSLLSSSVSVPVSDSTHLSGRLLSSTPRIYVLQSNLAELVEHKYGYRVLIQVLHPYCGRYLPPQLLAIARPPGKEYSAAAMQRQPQGGVQPAAKSDDAEAVAGSDDDEQVHCWRRNVCMLVAPCCG
jgi:hypothetical protein